MRIRRVYVQYQGVLPLIPTLAFQLVPVYRSMYCSCEEKRQAPSFSGSRSVLVCPRHGAIRSCRDSLATFSLGVVEVPAVFRHLSTVPVRTIGTTNLGGQMLEGLVGYLDST